jgi:hypothetical protein
MPDLENSKTEFLKLARISKIYPTNISFDGNEDRFKE